ncbi:MAG: 3-deoxy-7-phosphoheptulonate synthase [Planctomycetota bacterium]|jgi:3-deoxy-7-phosphoheptulonate synthase
MIFRLQIGTTSEKVQELRARFEAEGIRTMLSPESARPIFAAVDRPPQDLADAVALDAAVEEVVVPRGAWQLAARAFRERPQVVPLGDVRIGGGEVVVMAGPCSVDEYLEEAAAGVKEAGAQVLRGGAYKPRTSPYSFQGFGVEGLRRLKDAGETNGLPVVSEIMDASQLPAFVDHAIDCLQIGARNMQNFSLLKAIAASGIPVLLKRGLSGTVDEWLYSAEYLLAFGCSQVMLCERGIRTYETATRNTLDLTVLPLLREWTHLPIVVDPAHAVGVARFIRPLARASVAAGADGLTVEMHPHPEVARSDKDQALLPGELTALVADARVMAAVTSRHLG